MYFEDPGLTKLDFEFLVDSADDLITLGDLKQSHCKLISIEEHWLVLGSAWADPLSRSWLLIHHDIGLKVKALVVLTPLALDRNLDLLLSDVTFEFKFQIGAKDLTFIVMGRAD